MHAPDEEQYRDLRDRERHKYPADPKQRGKRACRGGQDGQIRGDSHPLGFPDLPHRLQIADPGLYQDRKRNIDNDAEERESQQPLPAGAPGQSLRQRECARRQTGHDTSGQ